MNHSIRPLKKEEYYLLPEFLYEAIYLPEGMEPPPRSVVHLPEMQVYTAAFGRPHDYALAAEHNGQVIGLVWARIMEDYGHMDQNTPSLAISLLPSWRGMGIGTSLLKGMLSLLKKRGYVHVSLSVQKANPAQKLYKRLGFRPLRETDEEYIMVCHLDTQDFC